MSNYIKRGRFYFSIVVVLVFCLHLAYLNTDAQNIIPGELLIKLKPDVTSDQLTADFSDVDLVAEKQLSDFLNIWLYNYNPSTIQANELLEMVKQHTHVVTAQFNHTIHLNATVPDDIYFPFQYNMNKVQAPEAWDVSTGGTTILGDDIVIAVLDNGFDLDHEDINYWQNTNEIPSNGIDDDNNGYVDDIHGWNSIDNTGTISIGPNGHGTHVAGIAGAIGNNGVGVTGINWGVNIMPIQAASSQESVVIEGYNYALEMRRLYNQTNGVFGANVVVTNASFSTHGGLVEDFPLWCGIYDALGAEGVLNINAPWNKNLEIGNDITDIPAQCQSEYLIVATNTDLNDELYDASSNPFNTNGAPWGKIYIDIAAPGTNIYSTMPADNYEYMTGTSMAAPLVAGAIALMYAAACEEMIQAYYTDPSSVALLMKQFILNKSDPVPGLLLKIGYGRLNINKSIIQMLDAYNTELYLTSEEVSSVEYNAINKIETENYSSSGEIDISLRAGEEVHLNSQTHLNSILGGLNHAFVDKSAFNCAIEIQPLTVDLLIPENPYCADGTIPISINAVPAGGVSPYDFIWYSKLISDNTWQVHSSANNPNVAFFSDESFYVKVEVTDNLGNVEMSSTELVACVDGKTLPPDPVDTAGMNTINLTEDETSIIGYEEGLTIVGQQYLRQSFEVYPNPFYQSCTLSFFLKRRENVSILMYNSKGGLVDIVIESKFCDVGLNHIQHEMPKLSKGPYIYVIRTTSGFSAFKVVMHK